MNVLRSLLRVHITSSIRQRPFLIRALLTQRNVHVHLLRVSTSRMLRNASALSWLF